MLNKIGKDKERWDLFTKKEEYDPILFYIKILQYCAQKGAWMASAAQIFNWWKKNYGCY